MSYQDLEKQKRLKVVDLFCGLKGWSRPFLDRGHEVWTTDIDPVFEPDHLADFMNLDPTAVPFKPDIVLASPPCETFSTMAMGKNWTHDGQPKTQKAGDAKALIERLTWFLTLRCGCPRFGQDSFYVVENPRARLRTLPFAPPFERRTVWYCRLGEPVAKPTDLWGRFPEGLRLPQMCHNGNSDHIAAPRGSRTGTQGVGRGKPTAADRAKVPYGLGLTVCMATEACRP